MQKIRDRKSFVLLREDYVLTESKYEDYFGDITIPLINELTKENKPIALVSKFTDKNFNQIEVDLIDFNRSIDCSKWNTKVEELYNKLKDEGVIYQNQNYSVNSRGIFNQWTLKKRYCPEHVIIRLLKLFEDFRKENISF